MTQYHDFQNTTFDINYRELAEEYFQGGLSQLVNGVGNGNGPRGRSRAAGGPVAQRTAKEDKEFIQRFLQLKYSILFLQRNKKFGRYCFYGKIHYDCPSQDRLIRADQLFGPWIPSPSRTVRLTKSSRVQLFIQLGWVVMGKSLNKLSGCWCLPNGSSDLGFGTGPPIDDIDRSCREFATCYNCLYNTEIGRGCDEDRPGRYTIKGRMDPVTKQKYLMCSKYPDFDRSMPHIILAIYYDP